MGRTRARSGAVAALLLVAASLTGCGSTGAANLVSLSGFGLDLQVPDADGTRSIGQILLCTRNGDPVTVESVTFVGDEAPTIVEWTVRADGRGTLGASSRSLREEGYPATPAPVTARCSDAGPDRGPRAELGLTVASARESSVGTALVLGYHSRGRAGTVVVDVEVGVCRRFVDEQTGGCPRPGDETS